jgi:hypothetical protein
MEKLNETARYKVGLFWFVATSKLSSRLASLRWPFDVDAHELGLQSPPYDHQSAWTEVQRLDRTLAGYTFDHFPRGRLEYYPPARRWLVTVDEKLKAYAFVDHVVRHWELPRGHLTVKVDESYSSSVSIPDP